MRKKRIEEEDVSLDSLLDTMTNVVAILVILLIVTQLGVSDAVKRIAAANPVNLEDVAAVKKSIDRSTQRLETLQALAESNLDSPDEVEFNIKNTLAKIDETDKRIQDLQTRQQSLLLLATAAKEQKSKQEELDLLQKEIQKKLTDLQKINAQLEENSLTSAAPTRVVNLPNPRSAQPGAKPFLMLIKQQKVYPLELAYFTDQAQRRAFQIIENAKLGRDPKQGIDAERFLNLFNKQKIRNRYFQVSMKANGSIPVLVFEPIERAGLNQKLLKNRSGPFWKDLAGIDPTRYYISFMVWPDSFETYMMTRQVCLQIGLAAGWAPQNTARLYQRNLGGKLRFGPPPPPPKPDPNKPPAPVNPPKPKPQPVDTID